MPLFTFNFKITYDKVPMYPWPKTIVVALVMSFVLLVGWELLTRKMHHQPSGYLSSVDSMWAQERRKPDQTNIT